MTQSLPDTQDLNGVVYSQDANSNMWGMLYATKRNYVSLELVRNEYSLGRAPTCDVVFTLAQTDKPEVLSTFSKFHFKIKRDASVVFLEDNSSNGTFINGDLVGRGRKMLLQHNDQISLAHPQHKVYVFMKREEADAMRYPLEVKKNYIVSRLLGSGACGEVRLVFQKNSFQRFAMKILNRKTLGESCRDTTMNEIQILRALSHPCIIHFHDVIHTPQKVFIFLELMEGGDLFDRVQLNGALSECDAKWIFYQIVLAVRYLHYKGIAHRDLKPENVLLSADKENAIVKITDFGLSKVFNSQKVMQTVCGTPLYVAPEILETRGCGAYTNKVDIWSIGVILYVCLCARPPFKPENENKPLIEQICSGDYSFPLSYWKGISSDAIELVKAMMTVDPKRRATIETVAEYKWLQDVDMQEKIRNILHIQGDENVPPLKRQRIST